MVSCPARDAVRQWGLQEGGPERDHGQRGEHRDLGGGEEVHRVQSGCELGQPELVCVPSLQRVLQAVRVAQEAGAPPAPEAARQEAVRQQPGPAVRAVAARGPRLLHPAAHDGQPPGAPAGGAGVLPAGPPQDQLGGRQRGRGERSRQPPGQPRPVRALPVSPLLASTSRLSLQRLLGRSPGKSAKPCDFEFLRVIGKGSFGKVLLARHKLEKRHYAVKVLSKRLVVKRNEAKHIMSERNVLLRNLNHPFLVGLHYSFQTPDKLYFVLDYVNGGELFFHLQRERQFAEPRARFYTAEMAVALGYLHTHGIVYRDLKPENLLLDAQGHVVLTDFGLSKEGLFPTDTTHTFCGTPEYLAPEVLRKEGYDTSVDWWCLGAVLYEMLYGLPPFYSQNTAEMYDRILNKPLRLRPTVSESARDILAKLLQKDRHRRLGSGYGDFGEVKQHDFFKPICWEDLLAKKISPPFNPNVQNPLDLQHIDPAFTLEPVPSSVGRSQTHSTCLLSASVREADDAFAGFSYAPPIEL
ncbi:serine/threonine-protein kinase Sgk2-like isoform X2 [Bacillus rossius redtenbacheri]|uniref:serine/threonine-protein kinase Sgk2-like isoform X2 n=1 Tax=Bacillus rossius redtenbacheri TaxID=93214 RepID=UPI002FDCC607